MSTISRQVTPAVGRFMSIRTVSNYTSKISGKGQDWQPNAAVHLEDAKEKMYQVGDYKKDKYWRKQKMGYKTEETKQDVINKAEELSEKFKEALKDVKEKKNITKKVEQVGEKFQAALSDIKEVLNKKKEQRSNVQK